MKKSLLVIFFLMGTDFVFCFLTTLIDAINYTGNKFVNFLINFLIFAPLIAGTVFLLLKKRKKFCIAAGFLYLIGGALLWLYKIIFFIYLLLSGKIESNYMPIYGQTIYLISFLISLLVIFFRLATIYLIKLMFPDIEKLEEYIHEKEHAELIQSLGNKTDGDDDKLCNDVEITEENLYNNKKNPFITGREKKEENEEEEINFQTTL